MPFYLGERVNLRFEGDAATSRLTVGTTVYTVHNGGLTLHRDGGLTAIVQLPNTVGAVDYVFTDASEVEDRGRLRVVGERRVEGETSPESVASTAESLAQIAPITAPFDSGAVELG
jgi:hypothetical protein